MRVLVTGASGFVGNAVCAYLVGKGMSIVGSVRQIPPRPLAGVDYRIVAGLNANTDWRAALEGVDAVVHCAARVHMMQELSREANSAYFDANVAATQRLASQADHAGVRRFVFVSSIKVNGERTEPGHQFVDCDEVDPHDAYARSKLEAERILLEMMSRTPLEITILRPPLIYGPHVRANFLQLLKLIDRKIPLPLLGVRNFRSLLYIGNFTSIIEHCLTKSAAAGQTFLVSDGNDISTPELIRQLAYAMGRPARLFPVPMLFLRGAATLLRRTNALDRLTDSLRIDDNKIRTILEWRPAYTSGEGFARTVDWYRNTFFRHNMPGLHQSTRRRE